MSNFTFFHNVFNAIYLKILKIARFQLLSVASLNLGQSQNGVLREWVNDEPLSEGLVSPSCVFTVGTEALRDHKKNLVFFMSRCPDSNRYITTELTWQSVMFLHGSCLLCSWCFHCSFTWITIHVLGFHGINTEDAVTSQRTLHSLHANAINDHSISKWPFCMPVNLLLHCKRLNWAAMMTRTSTPLCSYYNGKHILVRAFSQCVCLVFYGIPQPLQAMPLHSCGNTCNRITPFSISYIFLGCHGIA